MLDVEVVDARDQRQRDQPLEALWFRLDEPEFVMTAFVPADRSSAGALLETVRRLAKIGSSISNSVVRIVDARGAAPYLAEAARQQLRELMLTGERSFVLTDSPTQDQGAVPILQFCPRSVLVISLRRSKRAEVVRIAHMIGDDRVVGTICFEATSRRAGRRTDRANTQSR